jgi:hypothetical protein
MSTRKRKNTYQAQTAYRIPSASFPARGKSPCIPSAFESSVVEFSPGLFQPSGNKATPNGIPSIRLSRHTSHMGGICCRPLSRRLRSGGNDSLINGVSSSTVRACVPKESQLLKPLAVDVPIVPIKQQCEEQQRLGWLYQM